MMKRRKFKLKAVVKTTSDFDRSLEIQMDGRIDYQDLEKLAYQLLTRLAKNKQASLAVISAAYDFISDQEDANKKY